MTVLPKCYLDYIPIKGDENKSKLDYLNVTIIL